MEINRAWKSTCKVLLGADIGDIGQYEAYLLKYLEPSTERKSEISGRKVTLFSQGYCPGAKFISNDERDEYDRILRGQKLDVNDIKDIDSVVAALGEKFYYAGNIITGNSRGIEDSDACSNSFYVYKSSEIYDSKYVAYSDAMRYGEYVFGSNWIGETKFAIKTYETFQVTRCMEAARISTSLDCYYVAGMEGCNSCMFSFNQRNKRYMIGNNELGREDYARLHGKLLAEIRDTLERKKTVPTIVDIVRG